MLARCRCHHAHTLFFQQALRCVLSTGWIVLILLGLVHCTDCQSPQTPSSRATTRRVPDPLPIRVGRSPIEPTPEIAPPSLPDVTEATPDVQPTTAETLHPCLRLVDEACLLFGRGSEECAEARQRVAPGVPDTWRARCATTLERLERSELVPVNKNSCTTLATLRCGLVGENTMKCAELRKMLVSSKNDDEKMKGCLADILLLEGLP